MIERYLLTVLASIVLASPAASSPHTPGTLANPGFEGQPMKSMFFYPGQWRGIPGEAFYDGPESRVRQRSRPLPTRSASTPMLPGGRMR